jgi:hypothetical protein
MFCKDIVLLIANYCATWQPQKKYTRFLQNPMGMDVIPDVTYIDWNGLCENPAEWALDIIEANLAFVEEEVDMYFLCTNANPRAMKMVDEWFVKQYGRSVETLQRQLVLMHEWDEALSMNCCRVAFLKQHPSLIAVHYLDANTAATELLGKPSASFLQSQTVIAFLHSHLKEWTVEQQFFLAQHPHCLDWHHILFTIPNLYELMPQDVKDILSENDNPAIFSPTVCNNLVDQLLSMM